MFRPGRWRGEKNRVTAVFKLQFHATQVSGIGAEGLIVSVVPVDAGKPPVRSEKASVQDGRCQWETPIYERVIFTRELLTGKINRRIYRFILSTGLGRASSVGEVSVDFADYAEATKASSVSLPLKNSTTNAVLHVLIQRVEDNSDQSGVEAYEDTNIKYEERNAVSRSSNAEKDENMRNNFTENAKLDGCGRASSGSDLTLSTTSESSSSGLNTPRDVGARHGNIEQQDPASFLSLLNYASLPQTLTFEANPKFHEDDGRPQWEWAFDQKPGADDTKGRPDSEIKGLRTELSAMARKVDVSEMELQTMRRQITKESKRGQELVKEVEKFRNERDSLEEECRSLRAFKAHFEESKAKRIQGEDGGDLRAVLEEVRQEVNYEKEMNLNLRLQLQKTQQSNEELILAVRDLDEMLEQKNQEILEFSRRMEQPEKGEVVTDEEDQKVLEELVKEHKQGKDSAPEETKLVEFYKELDVCRREKDELEMQMEQLALDYEILKQENHEILYRLEQSELKEQLKAQCECSLGFELENRVEVLERDLEEKSKELSDSLATINELKTHTRNLEEELESREKEFEADLEAITREKIEQEKRAIRAEETLRKMQLRNASTAQKLQEEFGRLSLQMALMFDENEKAALRAMKEASDLRKEKNRIEELLGKADEEIHSARKSYEEKVAQISHELKAKQDEVESLKCEILRLREENDLLPEKVKQNEGLIVELGKLEAKIMATEATMKRENEERDEMSEMITMLKEEKEEKAEITRRLESELEMVRAEFRNSKGLISELELEKEKFKNQVSQLRSDLQKKEDAITRNEKRGTGRSTVSNGMRSPLRNSRPTAPVSPGNREVSSLKEKIKMLEGKIELKEAELSDSTSVFLQKEKEMQSQIEEFERRLEEQRQRLASSKGQQFQEEFGNGNQRNGAGERGRDLEALITESEKLREKNKSMEMELKDLQQRYSEMSVKFAEVEGERQQLVMTLRNFKYHPKRLS